MSPLPSAPRRPRPPPRSWPVRRRPGSPLVEGGRPSPGTGGGGRAVSRSPEPPQPRPRMPAVAGPSGGAAQAHGPDLSPRPPAGALPSLPAARRVTAAAPPPSWAWQALPSPAGSGQPRPQRGRAAPAFLPQGSRGRGRSPNAGAFYSLCALRDPQSTLSFYLHASPVLLMCYENMAGSDPRPPQPLEPEGQGRGNARPTKWPEAGLSLASTYGAGVPAPRPLGLLSYTPRQRSAVIQNPRTRPSVGSHLYLSRSTSLANRPPDPGKRLRHLRAGIVGPHPVP